jgi:glycosyltransferase involved in cell wall biosynthesis
MFKAPLARPIRCTYYPDFRAKNPYQTQLYDGWTPFVDCNPGTISTALEAQRQDADVPHLFHLHWEHHVLNDPALTVEGFLNDLSEFRDCGGKVLWSLHNIEPHEAYPQDQVADLIAGLRDLADVIHLHSLQAVAEARAHWTLPADKIRVVPHANYAQSYPVYRRDGMRQDLGLQDADMVVLLPGRIASYKNPDALVQAFVDVAGARDVLIIAGQFTPSVTVETSDDPRIILRNEFLDADDVARFHAAADFVALPYAQSLTSGSAILAATLGRGVLGPHSAGLFDAISSGQTGVLYDPTPTDALKQALDAALGDGPEVWRARGAAAAKASQARDITLVSAAWGDVVTGLYATPPHGQLWSAVR